MNRMWMIAACAASALACVDHGCPEGSEEIAGTCKEIEGSPAMGAGMGGADAGLGVAGSGGHRAAGSGGSNAALPKAGSDGEVPADGGADATADAAIPPTCVDLACGENARCEDPGTGPQCICDDGYAGPDCADIDECAGGTDDCAENATCENLPGSFTCACAVGYEGDGTSCTRNACEPRANPCDEATTNCRDDGSQAVCDCRDGFARCGNDASACSTNVDSDPDHCGECGFQCAGNLACAGGKCEQALADISLGVRHSCGLTPGGKVLCWGANNLSQLLRSDSFTPTYEPAPAAVGDALLMDAGAEFSCALLKNGELVCWGTNQQGQIMFESSQIRTGLIPVARDVAVTQLSSGMLGSCALMGDAAQCWGYSFASELGVAATGVNFEDRSLITDPEYATSVSMGTYVACATGREGQLRCWGQGDVRPREVVDATGSALTEVRSVSAGVAAFSACALLETGRVMCWGSNENGQLGNPAITANQVSYAVAVLDSNSTPLSDVIEVGLGARHGCALLSDGRVACWGQRNLLGTGDSGTGPQRSFVFATGVRDAIDLAVGATHNCIRRKDGRVQCWGENTDGQVGVNPSTEPLALTPVNVLGLP